MAPIRCVASRKFTPPLRRIAVQALRRQQGFVDGGDIVADPVLHQGQRLAAHFPEPGEVVDLGAGGELQGRPGGGVGLDRARS